MEIEYLDLKSDFPVVQKIKSNRLISVRNGDDFHPNNTLLTLSSTDKHLVVFSYILGKIFKIKATDYHHFISKLSSFTSFPKILLESGLLVEKDSHQDNTTLTPPSYSFRQLMLNLTPNCTLRCRYCYASSGRRPEKTSMPFLLAKKSIDYVSTYCQGELNLGFVGEGEPTFDFDLLKRVVKYAKKKIKIVNVGPLSTNGVISQKVTEWLIHNADNLQVSCDGPDFIQNKYRPLAGGKESSAIVEKTIKHLVDKGKDFRVRATIVDETFGNEKVIINYFLGLGVKRLLFGSLENVGSTTDMVKSSSFAQNQSLDEKLVDEEYKKLTELLDEVGMKKYNPGLINMGHQQSCGIYSKALFVVDPYGFVSSCNKHTSPSDFLIYPFLEELIIGRFNFSSESFDIDFKKLDKLKEVMDKARLTNGCLSCAIGTLCGTGCLYQTGQNQGSIYNDKVSCQTSDKDFLTQSYKYLAEKYLTNKKPCLEIINKKLYYSLLYSNFLLNIQKQEDPMQDNPYIYVRNPKTLSSLARSIINHKDSRKELTFFLLKFAISENSVKYFSKKQILGFLDTLQKHNVYYRVSRPIPHKIFGKEYQSICNRYHLPHTLKDSLELFIKNGDRVQFPKGKFGTKKFADYESRNEISNDN